MMMLKPAWLLERELPSQLLKVAAQLQTLPSSSKDLVGLLDKDEHLLSQVYQNPSKFIQDALVPIKGVLILDVLTNQADLDAQISLAFCLFELIRITTPNSPFEDELMKKAFLVIVSSFQALPDSTDKSYYKRAHILESISKVKSYLVLLDLECGDFILDIFHNPLVSIKDEHPSLMLAHIESILVGILDEADDLLLEFLISIFSRSQAMGSPSSTAQAMSKRVLEICASWVPLQQIISSINESMHSKEKEERSDVGILLGFLHSTLVQNSRVSFFQPGENDAGEG